jgi:hypothetical protein
MVKYFFVTLGHSAIHCMKISLCQYNTDTMLANVKVAIGDPMHQLANGNVSIELLDIHFQKLLADGKNGIQ